MGVNHEGLNKKIIFALRKKEKRNKGK